MGRGNGLPMLMTCANNTFRLLLVLSSTSLLGLYHAGVGPCKGHHQNGCRGRSGGLCRRGRAQGKAVGACRPLRRAW